MAEQKLSVRVCCKINYLKFFETSYPNSAQSAEAFTVLLYCVGWNWHMAIGITKLQR